MEKIHTFDEYDRWEMICNIQQKLGDKVVYNTPLRLSREDAGFLKWVLEDYVQNHKEVVKWRDEK